MNIIKLHKLVAHIVVDVPGFGYRIIEDKYGVRLHWVFDDLEGEIIFTGRIPNMKTIKQLLLDSMVNDFRSKMESYL